MKARDKILFNRQYPFRIKRVSRYADFDELLDNEDLKEIYPGKRKDELLHELRRLYPPEKESLGVMAIEIEK